MVRNGLALLAAVAVTACAPSDPRPSVNIAEVIAEVQARPLTFPDYPQPGRTYLSFSGAHGYQVIFIDSGNRASLWYPGNARALAGEYKLDTVAGQRAICWRYPSSSGNPVTGTRGGSFNCTPRVLSQKSTVAELRGDPFNLASGSVPYPLQRCVAPEAFTFDRMRFGC